MIVYLLLQCCSAGTAGSGTSIVYPYDTTIAGPATKFKTAISMFKQVTPAKSLVREWDV